MQSTSPILFYPMLFIFNSGYVVLIDINTSINNYVAIYLLVYLYVLFVFVFFFVHNIIFTFPAHTQDPYPKKSLTYYQPIAIACLTTHNIDSLPTIKLL